jgi:taurine dioxygenase
MSKTLNVHKVGGRVGAQIEGVDLRNFSQDLVAEIQDALFEHKALVFGGQDLTDADQLEFAGRFGPLTKAHPALGSVKDKPNIFGVDSELGIKANQWHTDVTFLQTPPKISTLRSLVLSPYGGNTLVANTATAYRDLPPDLRTLADSLWAVHRYDAADYIPREPRAVVKSPQPDARTAIPGRYRTAHPVVRVHPESGERGLFIGGYVEGVLGMSPQEGMAILGILQTYVTRPENVFRWRWALGDVLIFDNRITQHYAPDDYDDQPRLLHRATVAGDVPVGVDGRKSYIIEGDAAPHYTPATG